MSLSLAGLKIDPEKLAALPAAERELVREQLAEVEQALKRNPLIAFGPHRKQVEFMRAPHPRCRLFLGGNRSGKTTSGMGYGLIQSLPPELVPEHLLPFKRWGLDGPCFGRVVTPDLTSTMEGVVLQKMREWCPPQALKGNSVDRAFDKVQRMLRFKNGSWIQFMSNDQDLDKFGGTALHWCLFDEEPRQDIYNECLMRLIDYGGEMLFTMTPLQGMCVDTETEVLTKRGWKRWHELQPGEPILTHNVERGVTEWAPLLNLYRDSSYSGPMLQTPGHLDAMFTPDHKWVTKRGLVPWSELKKTDRAVVAAHHSNVNVDLFSPEFLELLGWFMAEGSVVPAENKMVIYQSASRYPQYCARIAELLDLVGAQHHVADRPYDGGGVIRRFVITGDVARQLKWITGYPKRLSAEFVGTLSEVGLRALWQGLLDGDGHTKATGKWEITTCDEGLADSVSMIGVLLGYRTNVRRYNSPSIRRSTSRPVYRVTGSGRYEITEFKRRAVETEAPPGGVWCPMTPNRTWVARRGGTAFITGNSWIYDEFFEPWENGRLDDEDVRVVVVDMDDNPHLSEQGKKIALQGLSSEERQARKSGRFVSFAGLIYPGFSTLVHVVPDEDELPEGVECFEGLDPGMRHMAAVVFCYLDSEDRLVVYDELAIQGKTVAEVAKQIKLKREGWGVSPAWTVIDPAARNRNQQTGRSDQQEYVDCGIVAFPGQNDVRAGINRVRQRLESSPPKLLISARCVELRAEIKKYRWQKDSTRTENAPAERPVKKDDHLLDALRYVVMQRPLVPDRDLPRESDTMKDRILRHHLKRLRRPAERDSGFGPGIFA